MYSINVVTSVAVNAPELDTSWANQSLSGFPATHSWQTYDPQTYKRSLPPHPEFWNKKPLPHDLQHLKALFNSLEPVSKVLVFDGDTWGDIYRAIDLVLPLSTTYLLARIEALNRGEASIADIKSELESASQVQSVRFRESTDRARVWFGNFHHSLKPQFLQNWEVKIVINLSDLDTEGVRPQEGALPLAHFDGVTYLFLALTPELLSPQRLNQAAALIDAAAIHCQKTGSGTVYVHCRDGGYLTGTVMAQYFGQRAGFVLGNLNNVRAVEMIRTLRPYCHVSNMNINLILNTHPNAVANAGECTIT